MSHYTCSSYFPCILTCSRYPCQDTWLQMPETWVQCQHSCTKWSASAKLKPSHHCSLPPITWRGPTRAHKPATSYAENPIQRVLSTAAGCSFEENIDFTWPLYLTQPWPALFKGLSVQLLTRSHTKSLNYSLCAKKRGGGGMPVGVNVDFLWSSIILLLFY